MADTQALRSFAPGPNVLNAREGRRSDIKYAHRYGLCANKGYGNHVRPDRVGL